MKADLKLSPCNRLQWVSQALCVLWSLNSNDCKEPMHDRRECRVLNSTTCIWTWNNSSDETINIRRLISVIWHRTLGTDRQTGVFYFPHMSRTISVQITTTNVRDWCTTTTPTVCLSVYQLYQVRVPIAPITSWPCISICTGQPRHRGSKVACIRSMVLDEVWADWWSCGFTSHSTQNSHFRDVSASQSRGLVWKT